LFPPVIKSRLLDAETLDGDVVIQSRAIVTSEEREPQVGEEHALEKERLQLDQDPKCMKMLKLQLQVATGAGKYLILLYRIQTINPQILHAPGES